MNEQQPQPPYYPSPYQEEDEISLKELILKVQEYAREVIRLWWVIVLITIPIVGYMFYQAYKTPITYNAPLTFMLNEDSGGGGLGGVSAILGQFGFRGGRGNKFNLEKMLALARSRRIVQTVLFEQAEIEGQTDYLANHIIREYKYHEKWEENEKGLKDFLFTHDSISNFNRVENTVLKLLHRKVIGGEKVQGLVNSKIDEDTGIITMMGNSTNEELSIELVKTLYDKLSKFYVDAAVERQDATFAIIKGKTDSLQAALNVAQGRLLRFQDTNRGLTLQRYNAEKIRLQQEIQKLILAYGESYKQLEIADFSLRNETPVVQVIDLPISPLKKSNLVGISSMIKWIFLGIFVSIGVIMLKIIITSIQKV